MSEILIGGLFALLLGAVLGSFANVLIIRMKDASTLWGRSQCVHCKTPLKPRHLVPIVSWLLLRGRCAFCRKPIHFQYPAVEALAACLTLAAFLRHDPILSPHEIWSFLFEMFFALDLLVLVAFDLRWKLLPIEFMAGSAIFFSVWNALSGTSILAILTGVAVGAGFLYAQVFLSKGRWMGEGDPWAGGLIGAALGWPGMGFALYLTYVAGGVLAAFLLISGLVKRGGRIPFAPFLAFGAILALWFAPVLAQLLENALHRSV